MAFFAALPLFFAASQAIRRPVHPALSIHFTFMFRDDRSGPGGSGAVDEGFNLVPNAWRPCRLTPYPCYIAGFLFFLLALARQLKVCTLDFGKQPWNTNKENAVG